MICKQCQKELPVEQFYRASKAANGRWSRCKSCVDTQRVAREIQKREIVNQALRRAGDPEKGAYTFKPRWSQADKDFVFANYGPMRAPQIARLLGRTPAAVNQLVRSGNRRGV